MLTASKNDFAQVVASKSVPRKAEDKAIMVPEGGMVMDDADVLNMLPRITWPPCDTCKNVMPENGVGSWKDH